MTYDDLPNFGSYTVRVLIIDDNSPFVLPLLRSFSEYNNVHFDLLLSSTCQAIHFRYSRYLGKIHQVDKLDNRNIEDHIGEAVLKFNSDIIVPTREWISSLLYEHKDSLERIVKLHPVPHASTLTTTGNKWKLNQWLKDQELPYASCSEDLSDWRGNFPVLIKPLFGIGGKGIRKADDRQSLNMLLSRENLPPEEFMLQEYIGGYDIDISLFAVEGTIYYHTIQKALLSNGLSYSKGIEFIKDEKLLLLVSRMISILKYTGIAHLDFRYDTSKDEYVLIDFNSRYWSTVLGSKAMGVNFPQLVIEWILRGDVKQIDYRTEFYYFSSSALRAKFNQQFKKWDYPVKLKDTQLIFIYKDPLPELMFLLQRVFKKRIND